MSRQYQKQLNLLDQCKLVAELSTCSRRKVGCIITDIRGVILSTGRNGVPVGFDHCIDKPCAGSSFKSGEGLDLCNAIHAEINALMHCPDITKIDTVYVTTKPCISCIKAIANTSCNRIIYDEEYSGIHDEITNEICMQASIGLLSRKDVEWWMTQNI